MAERLVLDRQKMPVDAINRILDIGAVYPNDKYTLNFNTNYLVDESRSSGNHMMVFDGSGEYCSYPREWFTLYIPPETGSGD